MLKSNPDVEIMLVDIMMPEMDGSKPCRRSGKAGVR